jgi:hypothetical protein
LGSSIMCGTNEKARATALAERHWIGDEASPRIKQTNRRGRDGDFTRGTLAFVPALRGGIWHVMARADVRSLASVPARGRAHAQPTLQCARAAGARRRAQQATEERRRRDKRLARARMCRDRSATAPAVAVARGRRQEGATASALAPAAEQRQLACPLSVSLRTWPAFAATRNVLLL